MDQSWTDLIKSLPFLKITASIILLNINGEIKLKVIADQGFRIQYQGSGKIKKPQTDCFFLQLFEIFRNVEGLLLLL